MKTILLLDILLFILLNRVLNFNDLFVSVLASIFHSCAEISYLLILFLHFDQPHDRSVVALAKKDFNYLFLISLSLLQALDLLGLPFDYLFEVIP